MYESSHQTFEGTWAEVSRKASQLGGDVRVRLEVIEGSAKGEPIQLGMFRDLGKISEEDFKAAEWQDLEAS